MTDATLRRLALALAISVSAASAALAQDAVVYKWTDGEHRVHYSDQPPEGEVGSVETLMEHTHRSSERPAAAPAASKAPAPPPAPGGTQSNLQKQVAADVAKTANEQCKQAQDVYNSYLRARHIYKEGDDKSRTYLSDTEMEEARVNAKRDVDEACKGSQQ